MAQALPSQPLAGRDRRNRSSTPSQLHIEAEASLGYLRLMKCPNPHRQKVDRWFLGTRRGEDLWGLSTETLFPERGRKNMLGRPGVSQQVNALVAKVLFL